MTRTERLENEIRELDQEGSALVAVIDKRGADPTEDEVARLTKLKADKDQRKDQLKQVRSDEQLMAELRKIESGARETTTAIETATPDVALDAKRSVFDFITARARAERRTVPYLGQPDAEKMSLGRLIRAMATGRRDGLSDVEQRALNEGTDASGGFLVPEVVGAQFLDRLRPAVVTMKAGALTVPMGSDTLHLARLAQPGVTPLAWKLENLAISESAITLERVTLSAHTLPCLVKLSVELQEDAKNIDTVITNELAAALALEVDRVALRGSGVAPEPRGILNQTGVPIQGSGVNGTALTYDPILDAGFAVLGANVPPENVRVIYNARSAKSLAKLKDTQQNYLVPPPTFTAWSPLIGNQIPNNLTVGTSSDCSEVYCGDFSELLIGLRTSFRLEVSRQAADATSSAFTNLQVWIRAYLRADIAVAHPLAFVVITGVRP